MSDKVREALDTALSLIGEIMSYSTFSVAFHPDLVERAEEFIAPFDQHGIDKIFPLTQPQPEAREEDNFEAVLQTCADYCRLGADGHLHMQRQPIEEALKRWALSRLAVKDGQGKVSCVGCRWFDDDPSDGSNPCLSCTRRNFSRDNYMPAIPAAPTTSEKPEEKR